MTDFTEDRWFVKVRSPDGSTRKERSARYGQPMRYRARYIAPDGRERSKSFPDGKKREADAYVKAMSTDITRGTWTDPAGARMTLRAFAEQTWYPSQSSGLGRRKALRSYLDNHILPKLGSRTLGDLAAHPSVIQQWLRGLPVTAPGNILDALSSIMGAALEDGLIPRNPCRSRTVRLPPAGERKIIPWEADRVALIRSALLERYQAMTDCGEGIGMRQGEVIGFSPDDIDWLRGMVHVSRQVRAGSSPVFSPPKGGKSRDVPLAESVKLRLAAHMEAFPPVAVTLPWDTPGGEPVTVRLFFAGERGAVIHASNFDWRIWHPARKKAGVPPGRDGGFHQLRHRYASVLLRAGVDIRTVSEYLGHHDPGFTLRTYCHLMPGGEDKVRKAIDEAAADHARTDLGSGSPGRRSEA